MATNTEISIQSVTEKATMTATVTSTEAATTTLVSLGTETRTQTVTSALTEKATVTLINFQTVFATSTSTVTEKAASLVPTTFVSTIIMTEKMLPVTVYMTSTATQPGQVQTLTERIPETVIRTEKALSIATSTETVVSTSTFAVSCSPTTMISAVPTTVMSVITETRPMTLTQKNVMTVTIPGRDQTMTTTTTAISTIYSASTVTQVSSAAMVCPLQEKTVTRIITESPSVSSSSVATCTTCRPGVTRTIPTTLAPLTPLTPKIITPTQQMTSSKISGGSVCPTPTVSDAANKVQSVPTAVSSSTSGSCKEGQKRCDMYDRRQYNECKVGKWSTGIKMTEADNMQCQESGGSVQLVPIPASNFHV